MPQPLGGSASPRGLVSSGPGRPPGAPTSSRVPVGTASWLTERWEQTVDRRNALREVKTNFQLAANQLSVLSLIDNAGVVKALARQVQ